MKPEYRPDMVNMGTAEKPRRKGAVIVHIHLKLPHTGTHTHFLTFSFSLTLTQSIYLSIYMRISVER